MNFSNLLKGFKGPQPTSSREKERENPLSTKLKDIWRNTKKLFHITKDPEDAVLAHDLPNNKESLNFSSNEQKVCEEQKQGEQLSITLNGIAQATTNSEVITGKDGTEAEALNLDVSASTNPFLGILIIIVDSLPHEAMWRLWIEKYEYEVKEEKKAFEYHQKSNKVSEISMQGGNGNGEKMENKSEEINLKGHNGDSVLDGTDTVLNVVDDKKGSNIISDNVVDATTVESAPIRFLIHAKHPERIKSAWVKERLVNFQLKPGWGSVELTEVMVKMLQEAVEYSDVSHFCFASESCVPILSLKKSLSAVRADPNSWVDYQVKANNGYATQYQFDILKDLLPKECIMKADQWVMLNRTHAEKADQWVVLNRSHAEKADQCLMLNRTHAEKVLGLPALVGGSVLQLFKKVKASDEMYFVCCLAILGLIPPIEGESEDIPKLPLSSAAPPSKEESSSSTEHSSSSTSIEHSSELSSSSLSSQLDNEYMISKRKLTSVLWGQGDKSPQTFFALLAADLSRARKGGSLFFRKLKLKDSTDACRDKVLTDWVLMILNDSGDSVTDKLNIVTPKDEDCNTTAVDLINDATIENNTQSTENNDIKTTNQDKFSVEYCLLRAREYLLEPPSDRTPVSDPGTGGGREGRDGGRRASISPYRNNSDRNDYNRRHSDNYMGRSNNTNTDRDQSNHYDKNSRDEYDKSSSSSRYNDKKRKIDDCDYDDADRYGSNKSNSSRDYKRYSYNDRNSKNHDNGDNDRYYDRNNDNYKDNRNYNDYHSNDNKDNRYDNHNREYNDNHLNSNKDDYYRNRKIKERN